MPVSGQTKGILHQSLVQTIVENIKERILNGELNPGERLTENRGWLQITLIEKFFKNDKDEKEG